MTGKLKYLKPTYFDAVDLYITIRQRIQILKGNILKDACQFSNFNGV